MPTIFLPDPIANDRSLLPGVRDSRTLRGWRRSGNLFTNAMQLESVLYIAAEESFQQQLLQAFERCIVGSVGPTCSEALAAHHIRVDIEPEHPKMGMLVYEAAQRASELLRGNRLAQTNA